MCLRYFALFAYPRLQCVVADMGSYVNTQSECRCLWNLWRHWLQQIRVVRHGSAAEMRSKPMNSLSLALARNRFSASQDARVIGANYVMLADRLSLLAPV